ncbi:MAG: Fur family transcriptional regulator [Calditrichota bacterium]
MSQIDPAIVQQRLQHFQHVCRSQGLKITPQRLEIFRELAASNEHPSAEQLYERIRERMPTMSLDTVYRSLATLSESGVVAKVEVLDERSRFDANTEHHHHFVCVRCHKVVDFSWPGFDQLSVPDEVKKMGKVQQPYAEIRGVCGDCLKKS